MPGLCSHVQTARDGREASVQKASAPKSCDPWTIAVSVLPRFAFEKTLVLDFSCKTSEKEKA